MSAPADTDVLVIGAGPAGSAAAAWAARAGLDVTLVDAATFPRDKPCGDGLTPRAIAELDGLGMVGWLDGRARNYGLRAAGFGQELYLPWPGGSLPRHGGAAPRTQLDAAIRQVALDWGATSVEGRRAVGVRMDGGRVAAVTFDKQGRGSARTEITCRRLVVADGARSQLGRHLGRTWHRSTGRATTDRILGPTAGASTRWIAARRSHPGGPR